jgi:3-phosphoshikimate 1-carboxyvinyltransferase
VSIVKRSITMTPSGPIHGRIRPPGSKSITNRALVCAALASGDSTLEGVLDSDDTRVMREALVALGINLQHDAAHDTVVIAGCDGKIPAAKADLFVGNSGTTVRFLAAMLALGHGEYRLDGVARMRERPIEDLLAALRQWNIDARSELGTCCPPVIIRARGISGGTAHVAGNVSSQFLSGLLLAAPYAANDVELIVDGELVSKPYVEMTLAVMRTFGVDATAAANLARIHVPAGQRFHGRRYEIEPDASAASYFFAAAAVTGGSIKVEGLSRDALQGDVSFCECLAKMGCRVEYGERVISVTGGSLVGIDVDMNAISDTAQTLAVVALFASGPTTIRGVGHNRHKETDRIGNLAIELRKLGATVEEFDDGLRVTPGPFRGATLDTYDDHRMAMSFAVAGLATPGVTINDPDCTAKTYPRFFEDMAKLAKR